jgi:hypothetical protein
MTEMETVTEIDVDEHHDHTAKIYFYPTGM